LLVLSLPLLMGCVTSSDLKRLELGVSARLDQARERAYICSPRELAESEADVSWARFLAEYGHGHRAKALLERASHLAETAWTRSRAEGCEGDRDDDGFVDSKDLCPDQPEEVNGREDEDGCPETDRDGDGVSDLRDRCPDVAAPGRSDGCPVGTESVVDRDEDGIPDTHDVCPDQKGVPLHRGCPPPDADADGIPDDEDRCPSEPGTLDSEGCPYRHIIIEPDRIVLRQKIFFVRAKSTIQRTSHDVLNEIATVLHARGKMRIRVEGHTDSTGAAKRNKALSAQRADAVRRYLIQHGIEPTRLVSVGFGEEAPVSDNSTREGRALNRRVDFIILDQ
jgi:outer membrane protein OmpA-like peptidoglycan-associated protein